MSDSPAPSSADDWWIGALANNLIATERQRQVEVEGYTLAHDRREGPRNLLAAARCYLFGTQDNWPWPNGEWKPQGAVRNLVRAGALLLAAKDVIAADPQAGSPEVLDKMTWLTHAVYGTLTMTLQEAQDVFEKVRP